MSRKIFDKFKKPYIKSYKSSLTILNTSTISVKEALAASGITVREWAQANGFSENLVYAVLNGKNKASRGESFRIAVALELKKRPTVDEAPAYLRSLIAQSLPDAKNPFAVNSGGKKDSFQQTT